MSVSHLPLNYCLINIQLASIFHCFTSLYFAKVAALFYSGALGAKRKYMRWLFALFIAMSGWAGLASGNLLSLTHFTPSGMTLSALSAVYPGSHYYSSLHRACDIPSSVNTFSPHLRLQSNVIYPQLRLMSVPVKKTTIKNRPGTAKFTGSANPSLASNRWSGAYLPMFRSSQTDEIYKQPRQSLPLLNHSNWILFIHRHSKIVWVAGKRVIFNIYLKNLELQPDSKRTTNWL
jgi:hypothetical protein